MYYVDIKIYLGNAFKASASYSVICNQANTPTQTHNTMTTTMSTKLYEQACIAADKANQNRFNAARLSVPDELHWYNNHTNWDSLDRKGFREVMLRMELITAQHYEDFGTGRSNRSAAIKAFWADEWGCEYLPETGKWLDRATSTFIESETEKKAKRDAKKALKPENKAAKASKKAEKKASKAEADGNQYNDEEEELYAQAAQQHAQQTQQQQQQQLYDDWFDAEEEACAQAYAQARAQEEEREQEEAQSYLDSLIYTSDKEEEPAVHRVTCQPVLYMEELTDIKGDPDWRAYIYYDERTRRYVLKGTRRSLRATGKKTVYPEMKLCFRSSRELASFLHSSTDTLNVSMFAMTSTTVKDATFAELCALPARGCKTELFGYDQTRPRYSTFVNYLRILRDVDASHSTFAAF